MINKHQKYEDEYLLSKYMQSHDNYWLGILLQRYTVLVLGVCMKYLKNEQEAKDAVQQIFFTILQRIDRHQVNNFKNWLYTVAKNHCLMHLRKARQIIVDELKEDFLEMDDTQTPQALQQKEQLFELVETSLLELNTEQRTCITLYYLKKHSYAQITSLTGFSNDQVKSYIQNGKRNLKNLIIKKQGLNG